MVPSPRNDLDAAVEVYSERRAVAAAVVAEAVAAALEEVAVESAEAVLVTGAAAVPRPRASRRKEVGAHAADGSYQRPRGWSRKPRPQVWIGPGHPPLLGMAGTYYRNGDDPPM